MKVLTVRQPWALHIIQSGKDVENRSRNIAGSYRGPVAIHAALKMDDDAMYRLPMRAPNGRPRTFLTGVIIGVVDLVGAHRSALSVLPSRFGKPVCFDGITPPGMVCSPWAEPGESEMYHLELAKPRMLATPIPFRGALGIRDMPSDVIAEIQRVGYRPLPEPVPEGSER